MDAHLRPSELAAIGSGVALDPDRLAHLDDCSDCAVEWGLWKSREGLFRELEGVVLEDGIHGLLDACTIPGHELLEEVHSGGQGTVFRAHRKADQRTVAIKILDVRGAAQAERRARFHREVELARRLDHGSVLPILESGEAGGRPWFAMEWSEGERLDRYLERVRPGPRARVELFARIVEGIAHAHQRGVIHRDIKPANILVEGDGLPRVLDFGIALAFGNRSARLTSTGEFIGTLQYASPEQVTGAPIDTRTDVYALGVLLYEMLTGELPWEPGDSPQETLEAIARGSHVVPSELGTGCDRDLRTVLSIALETRADHRYGSADALHRDMIHALRGEALEAKSQDLSYHARRALRRHRRGLGLAFLTIVVLAAVGIVAWRVHDREQGRQANARLVSQLMSDLLGTGGLMSNRVARLAVLEEAAERLESGSPGVDIEASVHSALGEAHAAHFDLGRAEHHLRAAISGFAEGGDGGGRLRAELRLCEVLAANGSQGAVELARGVLARLESESSTPPSDLARVRGALGLALVERLPTRSQDQEEARRWLQLAEAEFRTTHPPNDPEWASTTVLLGRIEADHPRALERFEEALEVLERCPGEAARTIDCLDHYSAKLIQSGRMAEAEGMIARALQLTRQTYGEERTVNWTRLRSLVEFRKGNLDLALRFTREALGTELDAWSSTRPDEAEELSNLGARIRTANPPPFVEAFRHLRSLRGDGDFGLSGWMNGIALLLEARHEFEACEALATEALEIRCRVYGIDCPNRQRSLLVLASAQGSLGKREQAEASLHELIGSLLRTGKNPERLELARARLAELESSQDPDVPTAEGAQR